MKINAKLRKQASKAVTTILKPTYFKGGVPINELFDALKELGIVVLQEDNTEWSGFLLGADQQCLFTLGDLNSGCGEEGYMLYKPYENTGMLISWYWMEGAKSGKTCEVIGYIS